MIDTDSALEGQTTASKWGVPPPAGSVASSGRIAAIDILRGIVMIVMALDHTREYFHLGIPGLDPTDPDRSTLILYGTRWITYFCAPTFVFLSGLSAYLRALDPDRRRTLPRFLASRGLWLICLELTIVGTGFTLHPGYLFLQVIWVIGAGFLLLALLCRLPAQAVFTIGAFIILAHGLLDRVYQFTVAQPATFLDFIDGRLALISWGPIHGVLIYSALGWAGILLAGYGAGPLFLRPEPSRRKILTAAGLGMILAFILLRSLNHYGDPIPWSPEPGLQQSVMAFLRVSKYPPSLDFTLITLGPMLILLAFLDKVTGPIARTIRTYGRVPLFYYLLHIYVIHGSAALAGVMQGRPFAQFTDPLNPPSGFGVPLWGVYLIWVAIVALLYFPCRWFERLRQRRTDWWLSFL